MVGGPHDVIVIGSGAAGLTAALALAEKCRVLVLAKGTLTGGSTAWAQGGIAAVLDAIDAIVPPGTNLRADDGGYQPPSLTDAALRRR